MAKAPTAAQRSGGSTRPDEAKDPDLVAFGARLRRLRGDAGLTQEDLAHAAGLHWTYVGQIERGERNLTYKNLLRLAHGLKVAPAHVVPDQPVVPYSRPAAALSPEQLQAAALLGSGRTPQQIAERLDTPLPTIRQRLNAARKQLGLASLRELAAWATENAAES